tara:strand:+ start:66 stop:212 length:147 start_codon:yes stop_codon:yes gene_type:complete
MESFNYLYRVLEAFLILLVGIWSFQQAVFFIEGKQIKNPFKILGFLKK